MSNHARLLLAIGFGLLCAGVVGGCCIGDAWVVASGVVRDPSGAPVPEAKVTLGPATTSDCRRPACWVPTQADGNFHAMFMFSPCVKRWDFILRVEKDGFEPYEMALSKDTLDLKVALAAKGKKPKEGAKP